MGDQLNMQHTSGYALGQGRVLDAQGHQLFTTHEAGQQLAFNMADRHAGLYIVQAMDAIGDRSTSRWMKP